MPLVLLSPIKGKTARHHYRIGIHAIGLAFLIQTIWIAAPAKAQNPNLRLAALIAENTKVSPGDLLDLTYFVRPSGQFGGLFRARIFVRSGPNGAWVDNWVIPGQWLNLMNSGVVISEKRRIQIPNWGVGTYYASLHVNYDHSLYEADYDDNSREIELTVVRKQTSSQSADLKTSSGASPLGQQQIVQHHVMCGNTLLRVELNIYPHGDSSIIVTAVRGVQVVPQNPITIRTDIGVFTPMESNTYVGTADNAGTVSLRWQPPEFAAGSTGQVDSRLVFSNFDAAEPLCQREIPIAAAW